MFAFRLAAALSSCFYGRSSCTLKIHFLNRKTFLSAADESRSDVVLQQCRSSRFCLNMFVTVGFIVLLLLYGNMSRAENHFRFSFSLSSRTYAVEQVRVEIDVCALLCACFYINRARTGWKISENPHWCPNKTTLSGVCWLHFHFYFYF